MSEILPPDAVARIRRPDILYTSGYLNDPIKFDADPRFQPDSLVAQFSASESGGISQYERDQADFIKVVVNSSDIRFRSIRMYSPLYDSASLGKIVDINFSQFRTQPLISEFVDLEFTIPEQL